ncbi:MAG: prepilin-type N-terminal cleavage/methylation domain-containing protein [Rhodocyclaceae bacterium]|nr:prepilin-type N-terminal cleavage/methylation domain-containing protein [Rhodocyclaceae bacterium]
MSICDDQSRKGFTLIEMMIVVAIIAILSTIAYPMYTSYIQRGKIGEAMSELGQLRVQLEQYYQDHRDYGSSGTGCGGTTSPIPSSATPAGTQYFSYACNWTVTGDTTNSGSNQAYQITATGISGQGMSGYTYTIDYNGNRKTTAYPGASGLPRSCWLLKSGDC